MFIKIFLFAIFILSSIMNVSSIAKDKKLLTNISKPIIMPALLLFYISITPSPNTFIILALIFGFLGDVFLMGTGLFFIAGLLAFLIGHTLYIIALLGQISFLNIPAWFYISIIPYFLYGALIYIKILPNLGSMKIPAFTYLAIILIMSFSSLLRIWNVDSYRFWLPLIGSLLFIGSDSMLSFNKFKSILKWREVLVMITYITAQFLIVLGFM